MRTRATTQSDSSACGAGRRHEARRARKLADAAGLKLKKVNGDLGMYKGLLSKLAAARVAEGDLREGERENRGASREEGGRERHRVIGATSRRREMDDFFVSVAREVGLVRSRGWLVVRGVWRS